MKVMEINNMKREEALEIFGLPESASSQMVEDRFIILTKRNRAAGGDKEQSARLAQAYDVLNGRAEQRQQAVEARENAKKYYGKTKDEWKVHFSYSWKKYAGIVLGIIAVIYVIHFYATRKDPDLQMLSIGHFVVDETILPEYAIEELGFEYPTMSAVDIVVDLSVDEAEAQVDANMLLMTRLAERPEVLLLDQMTLQRYGDILEPIDDLYADLVASLPTEKLEQITPISFRIADIKTANAPEGTEPDIQPGDEEEHIYGLQLSDPNLILGYGFYSRWPVVEDSSDGSGDSDEDDSDIPSEGDATDATDDVDISLQARVLIFGVMKNSDNPDKGLEFVLHALSDQDYFLAIVDSLQDT